MKKDGQKGETLLLIEKREKGEKFFKERTLKEKGKEQIFEEEGVLKGCSGW